MAELSPSSSVRVSARRILVLDLLAGYVDALGFVYLGGLFASAMTGNTTHLAAALVGGIWPHALMLLGILGTFFCGGHAGHSGTLALAGGHWHSLCGRAAGGHANGHAYAVAPHAGPCAAARPYGRAGGNDSPLFWQCYPDHCDHQQSAQMCLGTGYIVGGALAGQHC